MDEEFSPGTAAAVKHWQRNLKVPETGVVDWERVVYAPGPIRIAGRLVRLGASATGDVLSYTDSTRLVTVSASAWEASWAVKGTKVTVTLPTGTTVAGEVTAVGNPAAGQSAAGSGHQADPQPAGNGAATVEITVGIADQQELGALSGGPVEVRYVAQERKDVLTVPVDALLALAEGGYGLEPRP